MLFRLVVEKHGKRSKVVELRTDCARIGRAHGNEVRIPSADVSRRHCRLQVDDGLLKVEDLESINGTYLNGDLITGEAIIRPGDRLEIGPIHFIVEYELTQAAVDRLRAMDYEVVAEDDPQTVVIPEEDEEEPIDATEEIVEAEDYTPRVDLDDVKWAPSGDGDLRDLLTHLDEGQESLMPRKRPAPRPRAPKSDSEPRP